MAHGSVSNLLTAAARLHQIFNGLDLHSVLGSKRHSWRLAAAAIKDRGDQYPRFRLLIDRYLNNVTFRQYLKFRNSVSIGLSDLVFNQNKHKLSLIGDGFINEVVSIFHPL